MAKYKLENYTFDTEEEYNKAREDQAFIKAVNAKYDINSEKTRKIILEKYKPKSAIGRDFVKKLQELDNSSSINDIFDEIDAEIEEEKVTRRPPVNNVSSTNNQSSHKGFIILVSALLGILVFSCVALKLSSNSNRNDSAPVNNSSSSTNTLSNTSTAQATNDSSTSHAYDYGKLVYNNEVFAYVLPANCSGDTLFNDGGIEITDFKLENIEETQFDYNVVTYSGTLNYLDEYPTSAIGLSFCFLNSSDGLITEENAGAVSIRGDGIIQRGDSFSFSVEVYVSKKRYPEVAQIGFTSATYFD